MVTHWLRLYPQKKHSLNGIIMNLILKTIDDWSYFSSIFHLRPPVSFEYQALSLIPPTRSPKWTTKEIELLQAIIKYSIGFIAGKKNSKINGIPSHDNYSFAPTNKIIALPNNVVKDGLIILTLQRKNQAGTKPKI
jgi:hypothetical protein